MMCVIIAIVEMVEATSDKISWIISNINNRKSGKCSDIIHLSELNNHICVRVSYP